MTAEDLTRWTLIIAVVGVLIAVLTVWYQRQSLATKGWKREQEAFKATRRRVHGERESLTQQALKRYESPLPEPEFPLLGRPSWVPRHPAPLGRDPEAIEIATAEVRPVSSPGRRTLERRLRRMWPLDDAGDRFLTYSDAIAALVPPTIFFNGASYRLLDAGSSLGRWRFEFTLGHYFDYIDGGEALGYELASITRRGSMTRWLRRITRQDARDAIHPLDLPDGPGILGISTLTLIKSPTGLEFLMFFRDSRKVGGSAGTNHVVPAGEFQPLSTTEGVWRPDREFNLWHNIMREYCEELLGHKPAAGTSYVAVDYEHEEPYSTFYRALEDGELALWLLGFGLDPLTLKPELLTAGVFSADRFQQIFGDSLRQRDVLVGDEGAVLLPAQGGAEIRLFPFTSLTIDRFIRPPEGSNPTLAAGKACLILGNRFREELANSVR